MATAGWWLTRPDPSFAKDKKTNHLRFKTTAGHASTHQLQHYKAFATTGANANLNLSSPTRLQGLLGSKSKESEARTTNFKSEDNRTDMYTY
jgi:hypothetical protein